MRHIPWASALLVGLVAGVLLAQLPGIKIQRTIDLDGLISLLVGLILFFGLNLLYQRQSEVRRAEKDILIKLAQDALSSAERLDSMFSRCHTEDPLRTVSVREILAGLQQYNNAIHTLEKALADCRIGAKKISLAEVQAQREEYRVVLTETPFPTRYDLGAFRQQQRHHLAVRETFVGLILQLNRL